MSLRLERVRELLKRAIGEVILRELPVADAGVITVNEVDVASDLHTARVYVGIIGTEAQRKRGGELLQAHRKRIQAVVGSAVVLKYTPQLKFLLDESATRGNRVLQIIDEIERLAPSHDGSSQDH